MNLLINIIGIVHIAFSILFSVYAFVFKKNWFDKYYLILSYLVFISWTFFDGECLVTYVVKKMENPDYVAGSESTDLTDMELHFDKKSFRAFLNILGVLNIISIILVNRRNGYIPMSLIIILIITKIIYGLFLHKFMDEDFYLRNGLDKIFGWYQFYMRIFMIYLLALLLIECPIIAK